MHDGETMEKGARGPVLLTGATGFVGSRLYPRLEEAGLEVICASRRPERAREEYPGRRWVELDVARPETLKPAMQECRSALYLIHQISGGDYVETERRSARRFAEAAGDSGLERLVYLGGVRPGGTPSKHLESRLETGRVLRQGPVSCVELRAAMIIGAGSASWQIVCDLASRLPAMLLPKWTRSRSQPVWIGDVAEAVIGALRLPEDQTGWYDIPGPDTLTVEEILRKTAHLMGKDPLLVDVPFLTPKLSSYWLRFVTSCDYELARELVEGLKYDLLADDDGYWERIGHDERCGFDEAASRELPSG
jgi:uncharacterized protein YbjT (DUF2867 family)